MEIKKNYKVIIIGGDHYNTYGVLRSLGEEGIKSDVLILDRKSKDSFVLRSKYVLKGQEFDTHEAAIAYLESNYDRKNKNIIICCSDEAEELVLNQYDNLSKRFVLPVCNNYEETARLMNKDVITNLAKEHRIRVPETWKVINRQIPNGISYPCITKPITSTGGHKSDIVVCRNEKELLTVVKDEKRCADYVVQEYIEYEKEISILGAVLANGDVVLSGCIDKLRTCMIGTTSFGMMVDNSLLGDYVEKLKAMMKNTGYKGLFSAEFLLKNDNFYFLEVNFRNDGNTYVATASGQNLPLQYVQSALGGERKNEKTTYPCYFMLGVEDFLALRRNHVSLGQWQKDRKKAKVFLVYNKQDNKPFKKKVRNTVSSIMRRAWQKLINL
jgi:predicted ATP-grasp superfamily ATP-dependent carboligase